MAKRDTPLSPRLGEVLSRLLQGDAEKQIARLLDISPHTVHVYVKVLYRRFDVCSRGELLALFVNGKVAAAVASGGPPAARQRATPPRVRIAS